MLRVFIVLNIHKNNYEFKSSEEKSRQIRRLSVPIFELAAYFSAYVVERELIDTLEAHRNARRLDSSFWGDLCHLAAPFHDLLSVGRS